ncbi:MAG: 16S rRNA (cytosine(1402)-N(4))-methyltransferase RsmH [Candidatus Kerfeldbacteria bacterium]|nr:16S rRNA (cytosine(1402)-N(4))-methyltransferase RsmH [Candidatus Kerfeldbacteria bacterium]
MAMPGHVPVLLPDVLAGLHLQSENNVIDATLGGGGHAEALLETISPDGRLLGIETDQRTLNVTRHRLERYGSRFNAAHGNFRDLRGIATAHGFPAVDAILFDLGVSSMTLDEGDRGFSFQHDGPLDMRFDPTTQTLTAADIINTWSAAELVRCFRELGEERMANRLADIIVMSRRTQPFTSTVQLATDIAAVKHQRGRIHPATQVFQALRMAVNDELGAISAALPQAVDLLRPNGRLAVITFHSIEDRLVKQWSRQAAKAGQVSLVNKHVIVPSRQEQVANPKSRSAKLRLIEKINSTA